MTCFHLDHQNCSDVIKIVLVLVFIPRNGYWTDPKSLIEWRLSFWYFGFKFLSLFNSFLYDAWGNNFNTGICNSLELLLCLHSPKQVIQVYCLISRDTVLKKLEFKICWHPSMQVSFTQYFLQWLGKSLASHKIILYLLQVPGNSYHIYMIIYTYLIYIFDMNMKFGSHALLHVEKSEKNGILRVLQILHLRVHKNMEN